MPERIPGIEADVRSLQRQLDVFQQRYDREQASEKEEMLRLHQENVRRLEDINRKLDPVIQTASVAKIVGNFVYASVGALIATIAHWFVSKP